jgi:hypothetical protein
MIGTAAAILGASAIGAAGSLAAGSKQAKAAEKASDAQVKATQLGIDFQKQVAQQARIDAYPWALQGAQALYAYMDQLGIPRPSTPILPDLNSGPLAQGAATAQQQNQPQPTGPEVPQYIDKVVRRGGKEGEEITEKVLNPAYVPPSAVQPAAPPAPDIPSPQNMPMTAALGFRETPGYQFQVQEGEKGVLNNLAALGMKNSGAALKALTRFRQGIADQTYDNYLNRLASAAGMGQTQTNTTNALQQNAANSISSMYQDQGNARASGYIGAGNAWANAIGGVSNNLSGALGALSYLQ